MNRKERLKQIIADAEAELVNIEKQDELKLRKYFWRVDSEGCTNLGANRLITAFANSYETEEIAQQRADKLFIQNLYFQAALRFNDGEIDWSNEDQKKHTIVYCHDSKTYIISHAYLTEREELTYFTSQQATEKAIEFIKHHKALRGKVNNDE